MADLRQRLTGATPAPATSDKARSLRAMMWACIAISILTGLLVLAGMRNVIPRETLPSSMLLFAATALAALWIGARARAQAIADRARESGGAMTILIAAQLGRQDDATLEKMAGRGGPAADAARLILAGRRREAERRPNSGS